jgi:pyruvate formate lyase activating enzyme
MVTCKLCPFDCKLEEGKVGKCRVRGNVGGQVKLLTYGMVTTAEVGPIEQKPLYHFHPGMKVLSLGGSGCNMFCKYCQNYEISQAKKGESESENWSPAKVVELAKAKGVGGIAFTYSEPFVWYEYVMDVAKAAREAGLKTILKTNAYGDPTAFRAMCELMDAVNIDFKGTVELYRDVCGIKLDSLYNDSIWQNVRTAKDLCHLEVSTLAIPGYMSDEDMTSVLYAIGLHWVPLHILKFIPDYKMMDFKAPTNDELLKYKRRAQDVFRYVYVDFAMWENDTTCECGHVLLKRKGIVMSGSCPTDQTCPSCGRHHYFNGRLGPEKFPKP